MMPRLAFPILLLMLTLLNTGSDPAQEQYSFIYEENVKGYLMARDHRVFVDTSVKLGDAWTCSPGAEEFTFRIRNGERNGRYLSADKQGRLYLSGKPEAGSSWRIQYNTIGGASLRNPELADPPAIVTIDDRPSHFTDENGKRHTIYELRLRRIRQKGKAAEFLLGSPGSRLP